MEDKGSSEGTDIGGNISVVEGIIPVGPKVIPMPVSVGGTIGAVVGGTLASVVRVVAGMTVEGIPPLEGTDGSVGGGDGLADTLSVEAGGVGTTLSETGPGPPLGAEVPVGRTGVEAGPSGIDNGSEIDGTGNIGPVVPGGVTVFPGRVSVLPDRVSVLPGGSETTVDAGTGDTKTVVTLAGGDWFVASEPVLGLLVSCRDVNEVSG